MKLITTLAVCALALVGIQTASAQTTIVITGSTAFRSNTLTSIENVLTPGFTVGFTGSSRLGANASIYKGFIGADNVIIKTSWSGSTGGIQTVAASAPTKTVGVFPDATATTVLPGTSGLGDPRQGATQVRPDVAMGDSTQASTLWNGTYLGVAYSSLVDGTINSLPTPAPDNVGIVAFQWCTSKSGVAGLNMTNKTAQTIYTTVGAGPLSLITGNSADETTTVYAGGRDPDSGTRTITFAESGIGINSAVKQFKPTASGGAITSIALYATTTLNGVPVTPAGQSGEASGGTLGGLMANTGPTSGVFGGGFFVTYLGTPDAATLVTAGGFAMKYNGVDYSVAAIQYGQYSFWSYQHLFYRSGTVGVVKTVADKIATNIHDVTSTVLLSTMQVSRAVDAGIITSLNF